MAWSEVTENIGKILMPVLIQLGNRLVNEVIPKVQAFIEQHPQLIKWAAAGDVALLAIGTTAKVLAFGINTAIGVFNGLSTAIRFMGQTFSLIGRLFVSNPVLLIVAAVAVSALLIYKYWDQIKAFFSRLWDAVTAAFSKAWEWIKRLFLNYTPQGLVIRHWDRIGAAFRGIWDKVKAIFRAAWEWIKNLFLNYTPEGLVIRYWDRITAWFADLWNRVKEIFNDFVTWLFGLGTTFWNAGKNIVDSIWKGIKSVVNKPVDAIKDMVGRIRDYLPFSPAKTGALKDIHRIRLVETIAQSVKASPLIKAVSNVADQVFRFQGPPFRPTVAPAGSRSGGNTTIHFAPVVHLSGTATAKDVQVLTSEMRRQFERMMKDYEGRIKRIRY